MAKVTAYGCRISSIGGDCNVGVSSLSIGGAGVGDTFTTAMEPGAYSNHYMKVTANDRTTNGSSVVQKNHVNANQAIVILALTANTEFEDTSHTDVLGITDVINMTAAQGTGGTQCKAGGWGICFKAAGATSISGINTSINYGSFNTTSSGSAATTKYFRQTCAANVATTETALFQNKSRIAGWAIYGEFGQPAGNTRTSNTTYGNRWSGGAGGNGTIVVTVPNGSTSPQHFYDTSHSDNISVGDFINRYCTTGSGAGGVAGLFHYNIETSNNSMMWIADCVSVTNATYAAASTIYEPVCGNLLGTSTTESDNQTKVGVAGTANQYEVYQSSNGLTTTNTIIKSRVGGADGGGLMTITPGLADQWVEDTSGSDVLVYGNEVNWKIATSSGGTTVTLTALTQKMVSLQTPVVLAGLLNGLGSAAGSFYQNPLG